MGLGKLSTAGPRYFLCLFGSPKYFRSFDYAATGLRVAGHRQVLSASATGLADFRCKKDRLVCQLHRKFSISLGKMPAKIVDCLPIIKWLWKPGPTFDRDGCKEFSG